MPFPVIVTFACTFLGGVALAVWLLQTHLRPQPARTSLSLDRYSPRLLVTVSLLSLFLELLLIRWISSEIRIFAYLKNFVLIACFLGFGLGFFFARRTVSWVLIALPLAFLAIVVVLPFPPLRAVVNALPVLLGATSEVQIWGVGFTPLSGESMVGLALGSAVTIPLFALTAIVFIPFGQIIGWLLEQAPSGVWAYTLNVVASLAGIAVYTLLAFASQPPWVWFLVATALTIAAFLQLRPVPWGLHFILIAISALVAWTAMQEPGTHWSPYQKLNVRPVLSGSEVVAWDLRTNDSWYQKIVDLSPEFLERHPGLRPRAPLPFAGYNLPYRFGPAEPKVLILGSGMGNDVAAALRNGARSVTAVEIDPLIVKLGEELHPERPYASARVRTVVDDARSFVQNTDERFDLVVFSLLDSHTTSSHFSNIRIDNFVYTREAFAATRRLLAPDGVLIVKFQVQRRWIAGRLHGLLAETFGEAPLSIAVASDGYASTGTFFFSGSRRRIEQALRDPALRAHVRARSAVKLESAPLTTDDWPYFYQKAPGLPVSVTVVSILLLLTSWAAMRQSGLVEREIDWHFFFLGASFLLLEAQIVSRMALVFGTTWVVNSIVIGCVLGLVVVANLIVLRLPALPRTAAYVGLYLSLILGLIFPLRWTLVENVWLRVAIAGGVMCLPVLFASIVFIRSFATARFRATALGANLLGALMGGLLESLSLWFGLKSLLVLTLALYALSHLALVVGGVKGATASAVDDAGAATSG